MKKAVAGLMVFGLVAIAGNAWAGRVGDRQVRQHKRIAQGVQSGELTLGETHALVREQHRLQHMKRSAWADGRLTPKERLRLEKRQDQASRHIYRLKHNERRQK